MIAPHLNSVGVLVNPIQTKKEVQLHVDQGEGIKPTASWGCSGHHQELSGWTLFPYGQITGFISLSRASAVISYIKAHLSSSSRALYSTFYSKFIKSLCLIITFMETSRD